MNRGIIPTHLLNSIQPGFSVLIAFLLFTFGVQANDGGGGKDTARAVVIYNMDNLQIAQSGHSSSFLQLVDSVQHLEDIDPNLKHLIQVTLSVQKRSEAELVSLIDSLFSLEEIPYALINEINFQIAKDEFSNIKESDIYAIPDDGSPYPANFFYNSWNTTQPNPYDRSLTAKDSSLTLLLTADKDGWNYAHPVDNIVTSKFGWRDGRNHNGYDLDLEVWDPVGSAFAGVVRFAGWAGGFGRLVVVRHYNGLETYYAHLHRLKVIPGDTVMAGGTVGLGGSSGHSTGSHLHFEVRFKGVPVDPGQIIDFKAQALHNDTIILKKTRWSYAVIPKGVQYHTVKKGDYLQRIAQTYGTTIDEICDLNGIRRNDYLRLGQRIRVGNQ
jgi:murein DD-endopeptidase MepM/ murein hydrolase activator NlpD